jgi:hypothetical protein
VRPAEGDGLQHLPGWPDHTLPLINRSRLAADFLKVQWNPTLESSGGPADVLRLAIGRAEPARVVLTPRDTEAAFAFGRELGLGLFQGRHVEQVLGVFDAEVSAATGGLR